MSPKLITSKLSKIKLFSIFTAMGLFISSAMMPAQAAGYYPNNYNNNYYGYAYGAPYQSGIGQFFYNHPYIQKAAVVGGAGAAVGAIAAGDGYRMQGAAKGAMVGAGVGLGYEYLRERGILPW